MFVYLDESGDTGFKFRQGSTRYFVVTSLLVDDPIPLQAAVEALRELLQFTRGTEFKFSQSSIRVREAFFMAINPLQFTVRALIVDKELLLPSQMRDQERFYSYSVQLVLDHDYGAIRDATLVLDESFKGRRAKEGLRTYLRRTLNTDIESPKSTKILYHRSHTDSLLQVSDMLCGAIYAAYSKNESRYRDIIRRHIGNEWSLHPE